jgi:DNA-binding response OmpR family regulator
MNDILEITSKVTILYAEDDKSVAMMTGRFLERIFKKVYICEDGQAAFDTFNQHSEIKLVITDITMPKMSGIQLIKEIRALGSTVPILAVSAHVNEFTKELNELNTPLLIKPLNVEKLYAQVKKIYG